MSTIKAIETSYAGCRFRSRLEARWAVFFDALGIPWEYEPQGYVVAGTPYLPDFLLPEHDTFAEVKGAEVDGFEGPHIDLCRGLARGSGKSVLLLNGPPAYRMFHHFSPALDPRSFWAAFFIDYGPIIHLADTYWFQCVETNPWSGALEFPHDDRDAAKSFGRGLVAAVKAARSARFEHGERG